MTRTWVVLASTFAVAGMSAALALEASGLPDGPGRARLLSACSNCHTLDTILDKRQSAADWRATVTRMSGLGLDLSAADITLISDYLAANLGLDAG